MMTGAYNATAPDHKTNREFVRQIARELKKPFWAPDIPSALMKIIFGEMAGILLQGSRISSDKISRAGYIFRFPDLESALEDLLH
jgi:NAD dependent epimerase/dehydratase family enzyme